MRIDDKEIILGVNNRIIGYPGTGKTTLLIRLLLQLRQEYPELRITYLSFTNDAVNTARERLLAQTDGDNVDFGTIHSMAKRIVANNNRLIHWDTRNCGSCRSQCNDHLFRFASQYVSWYYDDRIKLDYTHSKYTLGIDGLYALNKEFSEPTFDMTLHYALSSLIVSNFGSMIFQDQIITKINKLVSQIDIPRYSLLTTLDELMDFSREWLDYKRTHGLFEFDDLILHAIDIPLNADILIIDEFQDLSALQYELIQAWSENIATVIVAGDYNQSIYGFQGGSPEFLLDFEHSNNIVLKHTFRLPKRVLQVTKDILQDEHGFDSVYSGRDDGDIIRMSIDQLLLDELVLEHDSVFILCRTNKQVKELQDKLQYDFRNKLSVAELAAYQRLCNLYSNNDRDGIMQILSQHSGRRQLFMTAMDHDLTADQLERKMEVVQFKTIHASKGLEADLVILYDQSDRDSDDEEERRVWYVGLTRSRGSLIVLYDISRKTTTYLSIIQ